MCDYSLERQQSRPAAAGEQLITTVFEGSTTIGFASPDAPDVAVCLLPGTEIVFKEPAAFNGLFSFLLQAHHHDCLTARFREVNADNHLVHHDALEFGNGQIVLLTHLKPGQIATVLQLPVSSGTTAAEAKRPLVSAPALVR